VLGLIAASLNQPMQRRRQALGLGPMIVRHRLDGCASRGVAQGAE
jgi:hypothetical protein